MKFALALILSSLTFSTFAQENCQMRVEKLRERLERVTSDLRACEASNPERGEIEFLRSENYRLTETNRQLRLRLDELEGRNDEQYFCSAACIKVNGDLDFRYLTTATAPTQLEADLLSKQESQKTYSCYYGVKTFKCDPIRSQIQKNFCTAACLTVNGTPDQRYLTGSKGRSKAEAEVLALKATYSKFSCYYGVGVVSCN